MTNPLSVLRFYGVVGLSHEERSLDFAEERPFAPRCCAQGSDPDRVVGSARDDNEKQGPATVSAA